MNVAFNVLIMSNEHEHSGALVLETASILLTKWTSEIDPADVWRFICMHLSQIYIQRCKPVDTLPHTCKVSLSDCSKCCDPELFLLSGCLMFIEINVY